MRDQFLSFQVPERVLQLHQLNKQIMLWVQSRCAHGGLEVEAQPFLDSDSPQFGSALRQVKEEHQIQNQRCCQNGVTAQEVNLNLHGIAEPSEDVDVIPTFFVVTTWRIIVN